MCIHGVEVKLAMAELDGVICSHPHNGAIGICAFWCKYFKAAKDSRVG
jgi:hypothetical protein